MIISAFFYGAAMGSLLACASRRNWSLDRRPYTLCVAAMIAAGMLAQGMGY